VAWRQALFGAVAFVLVGAALVVGVKRFQADPGPSAVDVGFLQDMVDHHDQAVQMAVIELSNGSSSIPRAFAGDVIASQRYEIGLMDARLEDWGRGRGSPTRAVMGWMGPPVAHQLMPGLATQTSLDALAKAAGSEADALFFRLMIEHHKGGIEMAAFASTHASDARVRTLAQRIVQTQSLEIGEMQAAKSQLGLN
jgi:uncharacterized protein (DUF305 family)